MFKGKVIWGLILIGCLGVWIASGWAMGKKPVESKQQAVSSEQEETKPVPVEVEKSQAKVQSEVKPRKAEAKQGQSASESKVKSASPVKQAKGGTPTLLWEKRFDDEIVSYSISSTGSRTVVAAGNRIYCFNESGEKLWQYSVDNTINDVRVSKNGSYTLVQTMIPLLPNSDAIAYRLLFFNQNGELLWDKGSYEEFDMSADGSYIVSSQFMDATDTFLLNNKGEVVWIKKNIGGSPCITENGDYIAVGAGNTYFLDYAGNFLWRKDGDNQSISPDGNYVALFDSRTVFSGGSVRLSVYAKNGDLVWTKEVPHGSWTNFSPDSNYLLACGDGIGFYFYSRDGILAWQKLGDYRFWKVSFTILPNNDVVLITPVEGEIAFTCVDKTGNTLWQFNLSGIKGASMSANGRYIIADDGSKTLYLYENSN